MMQNDAPVQYGKRVVTETYFDWKLHSIEVTQTEALDAESTLQAQELAVMKTMDLIQSGNAQRDIGVKYDIDGKTKEVKRIHVTHTVHKQVINVANKSKK